jgi:hypothetical protein
MLLRFLSVFVSCIYGWVVSACCYLVSAVAFYFCIKYCCSNVLSYLVLPPPTTPPTHLPNVATARWQRKLVCTLLYPFCCACATIYYASLLHVPSLHCCLWELSSGADVANWWRSGAGMLAAGGRAGDGRRAGGTANGD